ERLDAERDPDDRDAQDHATDEAVHRQPQPAEDDPDDVADDAQRARHAVRVLDMTAEGPQSEAGQLERLNPERDRDDEDEHHDPGDDEPDGEPDPDEDEPQDVAERLHGAPPTLSCGPRPRISWLRPGAVVTVAPRCAGGAPSGTRARRRR